jgi:hypothetical protein
MNGSIEVGDAGQGTLDIQDNALVTNLNSILGWSGDATSPKVHLRSCELGPLVILISEANCGLQENWIHGRGSFFELLL